MRIQKAKKVDLEKIGNLMLEEFSKPPFNEKVKLNSIIKSLNFYFKIGKIYLAIIDNEIIGVIIFKVEQYWEGLVIVIEDLVVKEEFRKLGVGLNLMNYIEKITKKQEIKSILFTTNRKSNAVDFYRKRGYKIEKNKINMRKNLK